MSRGVIFILDSNQKRSCKCFTEKQLLSELLWRIEIKSWVSVKLVVSEEMSVMRMSLNEIDCLPLFI